MLNYKLHQIRFIVKEVARLEGLINQMSKSRDYEKKKKFNADLKFCREQKVKLMEEKLLDDLYISDEEKIMADNYFYKGMEWVDAFECSPLYGKVAYDKKAYKRSFNNSKKAITRATEVYYPYYKKKQ